MSNTVPGMWGNSIKETRHNSHSYGTCALGENANNDFNKQVNASCRRQESKTAKHVGRNGSCGNLWRMDIWAQTWRQERREEGKPMGVWGEHLHIRQGYRKEKNIAFWGSFFSPEGDIVQDSQWDAQNYESAWLWYAVFLVYMHAQWHTCLTTSPKSSMCVSFLPMLYRFLDTFCFISPSTINPATFKEESLYLFKSWRYFEGTYPNILEHKRSFISPFLFLIFSWCMSLRIDR